MEVVPLRVLLSFALCFLIGVSESFSTAFEKSLHRSITAVFQGGKPGRFLKGVAKDLELDLLLRDPFIPLEWPQHKRSVLCRTCSITFNNVFDAIENGATSAAIEQKIVDLCINLLGGSERLCSSYIGMAMPEFEYIWKNSTDLTGNDICGTMFSIVGCVSKNPDRVYTVTLPDVPKPDEKEQPLMEHLPKMRVLHLADTHIDFKYAPGSNTSDCPEKYLCCRATENTVYIPGYYGEEAAGFWGDYRECDLPVWTLEKMFEHIVETHKDIDFIIWTGDSVSHAIWETSREANVAAINATADLILRYFPDTPIFPAVGNHEGTPANSFPQPYVEDPSFDISWLYDALTAVWLNWLPEDVAKNVSYGAFYSTYIIKDKLRVISVNSQYCYCLNWWLVMDSHDIGQELDMLAKELQDAEDKNEYVYIIGHIPPGNTDCHPTWSHNYNRIIFRYEHTISGLFYAHTHNDHFHLFFEPGSDTTVPYEIGYIAQSQTTFSDYNPGYKIYTIEGNYDGSRYRVLDHDNYILDLERSNKYNETSIFKLYSAKQEYGLLDLSPRSWAELVYEMAKEDNPLFNIFYRNFVKASPPGLKAGCGERCKKRKLCGLVRSDTSDLSHCDMLEQ